MAKRRPPTPAELERRRKRRNARRRERYREQAIARYRARGLTAAESLKRYRSRGGKVRTDDWQRRYAELPKRGREPEPQPPTGGGGAILDRRPWLGQVAITFTYPRPRAGGQGAGAVFWDAIFAARKDGRRPSDRAAINQAIRAFPWLGEGYKNTITSAVVVEWRRVST